MSTDHDVMHGRHHRFSDPGHRLRSMPTLPTSSSSNLATSESSLDEIVGNEYKQEEIEASDHNTYSSGHTSSLRQDNNDNGDELLLVVHDGHGLMVEFVPEEGTFRMYTARNHHIPHIHPNAHVPSSLHKFELLKGGGSGITVFGAASSNKDYVLKHGGPKDLHEVFALATLAEEFQRRGATSDEAAAAAMDMRRRVPQFQFLYISSLHLRDRGKEYWQILRRNVAKKFHTKKTRPSGSTRRLRYFERCESNYTMRDIRLWKTTSSRAGIKVDCDQMDLFLGPTATLVPESLVVSVSDFETVHRLLHNDLHHHQQDHLWKFTLAQQRIGNEESENGAFVHTSGRLSENTPHLQTLLREFSRVMTDLQLLTSPEERNGVEQLRLELNKLREGGWNVDDVSGEADAFCGMAIRKNFKAGGRFDKLRRYGELFRQVDTLQLTEAELEPARFLGIALEEGCIPREHPFFDNATVSSTALDVVTGSGAHRDLWWPMLLEEAVTSCKSQAAIDRIWTSGLTDAGLHNLFLSQEDLWLFDLGEAQLMPAPAFLTKFLMSFFHTMGMEDTPDGNSWVKRFRVNERGQFSLAPETREMVPRIREIFVRVLDHFVDTLFDGEMAVKRLLLRYVVLQLLSDASFCLGRWKSKGGGSGSRDTNSNVPASSPTSNGEDDGDKGAFSVCPPRKLEKWLWRSLWDIFVSTYVYHHLLAPLQQPEAATS